MSGLPDGWAETSIFEISKPKQWKTIPKKNLLNQGYTVYGANGIIGYYSEYTHLDRTLMITCRGASCGNVHISLPKSYINGNAMALDNFSSQVSINYVYYFLKYDNFKNVISGSAQPQITQEGLKKFKLKIAPLNEQIRIANKLDSLLGKLEATQKRLDKIPTLLKRFRQSVLAAAVSGELTKEWRAQNSLNFDSWSDSTLDEITLSVSDGDHQAPPRANTGIPFLVISNVSSGVIKLNEVSRWVTEEYFSSLKNIRIPKKGDILYTVTGSFGIPVMVVGDEKFCFQRHIAIIKPDKEKIETGFLFRYLQSSNAFEQAKAVATGTAQKTVPLGGLRKFKICYPKPEEQKQIIKRVETLFKLADKVEQQYQAAKQRTDKLTQSILAKAFRGELVPQDPSDEPASELLARILTTLP